jgi:hypothetical protein
MIKRLVHKSKYLKVKFYSFIVTCSTFILLNFFNFVVQNVFLELDYENSQGKQILVSSIEQFRYFTL